MRHAAQDDLNAVEDRRREAITARDAAVLRARSTGTSAARIAELIGTSRELVYRILSRAGFTNP